MLGFVFAVAAGHWHGRPANQRIAGIVVTDQADANHRPAVSGGFGDRAVAADGWDVPAPGPVLWTDERADILRVIKW